MPLLFNSPGVINPIYGTVHVTRPIISDVTASPRHAHAHAPDDEEEEEDDVTPTCTSAEVNENSHLLCEHSALTPEELTVTTYQIPVCHAHPHSHSDFSLNHSGHFSLGQTDSGTCSLYESGPGYNSVDQTSNCGTHDHPIRAHPRA
jgi:hypothetical protein